MRLGKHSIPEVAIDFMNRDHQVFIDLVISLEQQLSVKTDPALISQTLDELLQHTVAHFAEEEKHMRAASFPPYPVHHQEHQQVLAGLQEQIVAWSKKHDATKLMKYVQDTLPAWLAHHVQSMDFVTAAWLARAR